MITCSYCLEEIEDEEPAIYLLYGNIEDDIFVSDKNIDNVPYECYYHENCFKEKLGEA